MAKNSKSINSSIADIFHLLMETGEREKKRLRQELLAPLGVKEFFVSGSITINKRICKGVECKLCIKACPTNALYWRITGEVGIIENLCIYCGACVLNCIVDNCIKITRKREKGLTETFSTPRAFTMLEHSINVRKRYERVKAVFPTAIDYLKFYRPQIS